MKDTLSKKFIERKNKDIADLASVLHEYWTGCNSPCDSYYRIAQKVHVMLDNADNHKCK